MYQQAMRYGAVPVDEIAFAMTLFVEAANLEIPKERTDRRSLPMMAFGGVFEALTSEMSTAIATHGGTVKNEGTIEFPFQMLWQHYEGDLRRTSICARVLGFHSLMLQTSGSLVERWLRPCPDSPESVVLDPLVVEAVASAPLGGNGVMSSASFLARLEELASAAPHYC